jgi:hypothetical protein
MYMASIPVSTESGRATYYPRKVEIDRPRDGNPDYVDEFTELNMISHETPPRTKDR